MKDQKINFKLVNIALIIVIIWLVYAISPLWMGIVNKIFAVITPFLIAFAIAYALYPLVRKLKERGMPNWASLAIVSTGFIGTIILLIALVVPLVYNQTLSFLTNLSVFIDNLGNKYELNLGVLESYLSDASVNIVSTLGRYISDGAVSIISSSLGILTSLAIIIFVAIYLLVDMEKMRFWVRKTLSKRKDKAFPYIRKLDKELTNYVLGLGLNMLIQFFEYVLAYSLIGHPNWLVLAVLASITTIIPYFGGLVTNIIALLIASVISTKLLLLTLLVVLICPNIDGYIIGPKVYGKTNKIHPLINIFAVFAGGILLGFWGIVISLPVAIIIITTYKFFKVDIREKVSDKIEEIKDNRKENKE